MTRLSLLSMLLLAFLGCRDTAMGVVRAAECERTCRGCCDLTGTCLPGNTVDACGAPGDRCVACGSGELCADHGACFTPDGVFIEQPDAGTAADAGSVTPVDAGTPLDAGSSTPVDAGTGSMTCPPDGWCRDVVPTTAHLRSVWALAPNDVWVAGDQGTVLHFDGNAWNPVSVGRSDDFFGIWASGPTDVWVVGGSGFPSGPIGVVVHFDGTSWTTVKQNIPRVDAVWGSGASDVWFVGTAGSMHHWDGTTFTTLAPLTTKDITDVHGVSATSVTAVGASGLILSWDGSTWQVVPTGQPAGFATALSFSATETWVAGGNAFVRRSGSTWSSVSLPLDVTVMSFWGASPTAVWSVGPAGEVRFFNGTQPVLKNSGTTQFLRDVHGCDATHVWAVGFNGTILRFAP